MWKYYNPNPCGRNVGDCAVRAIAKALDLSWETAFVALCYNAMQMCDMPSSDSVWGALLRQSGFVRSAIPNACPDCYTAEDFCEEHPRGCCFNVAVENTSAVPTTPAGANAPAINVQNANLVISRIA